METLSAGNATSGTRIRSARRSAVLLPTLIALTVSATGQAAPEADALDAVVESAASLDTDSFEAFLDALAGSGEIEGLQGAREALENGEPSGESLVLLARLLGVYNLTKNREQALEMLSGFVATETFARDEYPDQHENPAIIEFGTQIEELAGEFDLDYRNIDDRIFEVTLDGPSDDVFGVLTHADVVPVQSRDWTVEDGVEVDPFDMEVIGNRIYGRGTIDDKGSIVAALLAMRTVRESGLPLGRDIRLMIETTEETSGLGMEYYLENESIPDYNIVLDSDYPAVVAEKGYGTISATFPTRQDASSAPAISGLTGASASNQIPEQATANIRSSDAEALADTLTSAAPAFIEEHGGDFDISVSPTEQGVEVQVSGTSSHASEPENGVNPVPRLAAFLMNADVDLAPNEYHAALAYVDGAYGLDYLGERLDVAYADDFMGPLTLSPTYFESTDEGLEVAVNVRAPRHPDTDVAGLRTQITEALENWKGSTDADPAFEVTVDDWMYRDPSGAWLNELLAIYGETTGNPSEPISSPGSTTAKLLPNAVNFGPNIPTDKYMGHTESEYKRLDVFEWDLQMFTEMMVRISNLESME